MIKEKNMQNEKIIKLIEDLGSAGYKIEELDCCSDLDTKILLHSIENTKNPFPKGKMIKIVEILSSVGYSILKYGFSYEHSCEIKLVLRKLDKNSDFLEAVSSLPERKKNDGSGRAASAVADKFKVSLSTIYQIRTILKKGTPELVDALRKGDIHVKTAYKNLRKEKTGKQEQAAG
jgi:hypothetical protein